jgi:hypothetical protein
MFLFSRLLAAVAVLVLILIPYVSIRPQHWAQVKLEMSRGQVFTELGLPDQDTGDVKGCFWWKGRPFVKYELWICFDRNNRVTGYYVARFIGTSEHFHRSVLTSQFSERFGKDSK